MVDIGSRIKELRTEGRMTQAEFAERLGVTKSSISSYENGSRLPSYDVILEMSRIFKASTDALLGHGDKSHATLDVAGLTNGQVIALKDLIENYRKANAFTSMLNALTDAEKEQTLKYIEMGRCGK